MASNWNKVEVLKLLKLKDVMTRYINLYKWFLCGIQQIPLLLIWVLISSACYSSHGLLWLFLYSDRHLVMGTVRMRVKASDKNITIIQYCNNPVIHTTPVHQLTSCEAKICVCEKQMLPLITFLASSIHNTFSSEKDVWSESGEKYAQIKHCLQVKTVQNRSKQICGWILMQEDNGRWTSFSFFYRSKCYYGLWTRILARSDGFKVKVLMMEWIIVMFLSAV